MNITIFDQPVAKLFTDSSIFQYPLEKIWNPKGISLDRRIKKSSSLKKQLDKILTAENLEKYFQPVNSAAPTRCIDGRQTLGWDNFSDKRKKYLGPKVPGGTPHAALTQRIVDATKLNRRLHFEDDIEFVVHRYKDIGIGFGGHVDTHKQNDWNTGCGAVDNINLILNKLQRPEPQEQIRFLAQEMMGKAYDGNHMVNEVIGSMLLLDAVKPSYMPKEGGKPEGEYLYKKIVVDLLRKEVEGNDDSVPQLSGKHNEVAVVLNWSENKTFDTDHFCADNDSNIQVFGWDIWEVYHEAIRLYPYSMYASQETQQEAVTKRNKHITTRILLGISTMMVLTDGSLKLVAAR